MKSSEERELRFTAFRQWLRIQTQLGDRPIGDVIARVRRVERGLPVMTGGNNLDDEYARDRLEVVMQALEYSLEDMCNHRLPPTGIVFRVDPQNPLYYQRIREGLSSLRNAVVHYRNFCASNI